jgi:hypothetical protein
MMGTHTLVHELFGRFQNLNLAVLREDLRRGLTAKGDWASSGNLCPLAHGMSDGEVVRQLRCISQAINLEDACREAARHLGAAPIDVYRFVCLWDETSECESGWLAQQLDELWAERLEDAEFMQLVLGETAAVNE